jgi:hypothetical protein
MRNPFTIRIETRVGVLVVLFWAFIFLGTVLSSVKNFEHFLVVLDAETPVFKTVTRIQRDSIDAWLRENNLNDYGDAAGTVYENIISGELKTGSMADRYAYLLKKFPDKPWLGSNGDVSRRQQQ